MAPLYAESIAMLCHYLNEIGITGFNLMINTRGVAEDRIPAEQALKEHFKKHIQDMCEDCQERLERNVWRILDCKCEACQSFINQAPDVASLFGEKSREYFKRVCDTLTNMGIPFTVEPRLVRGLDYYVHTVFELTHPGLGGQNAIAGGGRYELTVPGITRPIQGVGFAAGMERLMMVRNALGVQAPGMDTPDVFLVSLGEQALQFNTILASKLRQAGISTSLEFEAKSMKSQMRAADRLKAKKVLILGDSELESGKAALKDMSSSEQTFVELDKIVERLK